MPFALILQFSALDTLVSRLRDLSSGAAEAMVNLLLALLVVLVGWGLAALLAMIAKALLRAVRFNEGVRGLTGDTGMRHEPAAIAAWALYWLIIVVALMLALDTMGFTLSSSVGARLADVLPRILVSAVLLAIGVCIAMLVGAVVRRFFETAGLRGARLRGQVVTWVLSGFAGLVALEQLGLAAQFIMAIGVVSLAAVGLALGLAFGLGCRDLARDFVVEYLRSMDEQGPQRPA